MNLSFKEKCLSLVLSIALGVFAPSAAFASQSEGSEDSECQYGIGLQDAAANAISLPLNETLRKTFATDSETLGVSMRFFKIELPAEGDLTTTLSVDYSGATPGTLTSEFTVDPKEKSMQFKDWSGSKGGTNETLHLQAGTYYLSIMSMSRGLSEESVSMSVRADFEASADKDSGSTPNPEPSPKPDPEPSPSPEPNAIDISSAIVRLDGSYFDYTGGAITPEVTSVKVRQTVLRPGEDYEVSCSNNVNAGTAYCVVSGVGKYSGSVSKPFTIKPVYLTDAVIDEISNQKWTGSEVEPDVKVSLDGRGLINGVDYTLEYWQNIDPGSARVYVNGIGNYKGQASTSFQIVKDLSQEQLLEEGITESESSDGKGYFGAKWLIDLSKDSLVSLFISNLCVSPDYSSSMTYLVGLENEDKSISYVWSMNSGDYKTYGLLPMPAGKWALSITSLTNAYHTVSVRYDTASTPAGAVVERESNYELDTATPISVGDKFMGSIYDPFDSYESTRIGDLDYYKFTLQSPKRLQIRMSNQTAMMFGLCNSEGDFVKRGNDPQGDSIVGYAAGDRSGDVVLDTGILPAGTYYFLVTSGDQNAWGKSYYGYISERLPFDDVAVGSWYYAGVKFVYEKGLITGYSGTTVFGVGDTLTRAQLATILYRNANPDASSSNYPANATGMSDVKSGEWYTAGVNWAVKEGVIKGYADSSGNRIAFGPDDPVTFEQLVTVLSNCSASEEELPQNTGAAKLLASFNDGAGVSPWARPSMAWAIQKGLVSGYDEPSGKYLRSGEKVARERVAVVLMRAFEMGILR